MPGLLGLLDLIAAPSPEQARGLLSDLVAAPRNRLRGLLSDPSGFLQSALSDVVPTDQQAQEQLARYRMPASQDYAMGPSGYDNKMLDIALAGVVRNPQLEQKAIKQFGVTYSPSETGYILDSGKRLDFSGRHYASGYRENPALHKYQATKDDYLRGQRNVDHRELGELLEGGGSSRMNEFIDQTGAVRYSPNTGAYFVDSNMPSPAQIEMLVQDFRRSGEPLYLDVANKATGNIKASEQFARPTVEQVTNWLKQFIKD